MSSFEVFDLEKIPICKETEADRKALLDNLPSQTDKSKPGGKAYWYSKHHVHTKTGKKRHTVDLSKSGDVGNDEEYDEADAAMEKDWGKMTTRAATKSRKAVKDEDDDSDDTEGVINLTTKGKAIVAASKAAGKAKAKGRGRGKGRGKENALMLAMGDMTPKQKERAQSLIDKKDWLKVVASTQVQMVNEVEDLEMNKKNIDAKSDCVGINIQSEWKKQQKRLKPAKDALKAVQQSASDQEPAWFSAKKQQTAKDTGVKALADYKRAKADCFKCIAMIATRR